MNNTPNECFSVFSLTNFNTMICQCCVLGLILCPPRQPKNKLIQLAKLCKDFYVLLLCSKLFLRTSRFMWLPLRDDGKLVPHIFLVASFVRVCVILYFASNCFT